MEIMMKGAELEMNYPNNVYIELTKNCNMRCKMCRPSWDNNKRYNMKPRLFRRIARELFPSASFVDLRGWGESMLYPYWNTIFKEIDKYDCNFGLITNLSSSNPDLLHKFVKRGFWIGISIDGADYGTYSDTRGKYYARVIFNLAILKDYMNKYFLVTVQEANYRKLQKFIWLAKLCNVRVIELNPIKTDDMFLKVEDVKECKKEIRKLIRVGGREGIEVNLVGEFFDSKFMKSLGYKKMKCTKGVDTIFVNHDGSIGPCNHLMGHVILGRSIKDFGNNNFKKFIKEKPEECFGCLNRWCRC